MANSVSPNAESTAHSTINIGTENMKKPATVSSSSSLEDLAGLQHSNNISQPPIADPLSILSSSSSSTFPSSTDLHAQALSTNGAQSQFSPTVVGSAPNNLLLNNANDVTAPPYVASATSSSVVTNPLAPATTQTTTHTTSITPSVVHSMPTPSASVPAVQPLLMATPTHVPIMPSLPPTIAGGPAASAAASATVIANNTVPEFLYQLTKMLTDNNREVIEWANGKIEVHNPHRLASEVLQKYFRHSKFASFQRQLNYFGFRKLAGKGKMAPCSYVNDATTPELRSLLLIKRKTSATTAPKDKNGRKRDRSEMNKSKTQNAAVNPVLANILHKTTSDSSFSAGNETTRGGTKLKVAVGKGVKHQLNGYLKHPGAPTNSTSTTSTPFALAQTVVGKGVSHGVGATSATANPTNDLNAANIMFNDEIQNSLSELTNNYRNSLNDYGEATTSPTTSNPSTVTSSTPNPLQDQPQVQGVPVVLGMISRNSSLIDLAMLDPTPVSQLGQSALMPFVDFPFGDIAPSSNNESSTTNDNQNTL